MEFLQWQLYDKHLGLTDRQGDMKNALLCSLLRNINRGADEAPSSLEDFLLFADPAPPPDPDELDDRIRMIFGSRVAA